MRICLNNENDNNNNNNNQLPAYQISPCKSGMNQSNERCKPFKLRWYTLLSVSIHVSNYSRTINTFSCHIAIAFTRFPLFLFLHYQVAVTVLAFRSYHEMQRDYQRTGIWPVGSIIQNLNVSINRHIIMICHKIHARTTADAIDESIKSMSNGQKSCW